MCTTWSFTINLSSDRSQNNNKTDNAKKTLRPMKRYPLQVGLIIPQFVWTAALTTLRHRLAIRVLIKASYLLRVAKSIGHNLLRQSANLQPPCDLIYHTLCRRYYNLRRLILWPAHHTAGSLAMPARAVTNWLPNGFFVWLYLWPLWWLLVAWRA